MIYNLFIVNKHKYILILGHGPLLKSLFNLSQYRFCFMFWFFWLQGMWDLSSLKSEVKVKVAQLCPTLCDPMDYIHGIL